ncbi:MAG: PhzF family phenazine biosynthesis protein [Paracoccaceae bacterium]
MRAYKVVDVFTDTPFRGNPVAVVLNAEGLSTEQMQAIAAWTNLSETTFALLSTTGDYRLRIFTPRIELPFAGHPTIGSAHALIEAGIVTPRNGTLVQDCAAGLVTLHVEGGQITIDLPPATLTDLSARETAALDAILGNPTRQPAIVDLGIRWIVADVLSPETLLTLTPDLPAMARFEKSLLATGVTLFAPYPDGRVEVRSFAPSDGISEDPVCGSGNGAVGYWRRARGDLPAGGYVAEQGQRVGRAGRITVSSDGETLRIGGQAVTTVNGTILL